jgi:toxin YoeB
MKILFTVNSWEDYIYWQNTDKKVMKRINEIIKDIIRNVYEGIGKPEPLKYDYQGYWSRRINQEHRLVYKVENNTIFIAQCRYHY